MFQGNYSWSPVGVGTAPEAGISITVKDDAFPKYFFHFKEWDFYYVLPEHYITSELTRVCGPLGEYAYSASLESYAENRYSRMLAGVWLFTVIHRKTGNTKQLGKFILLPSIQKLEERKAVNLVLEDLLSLPQITLPPEWAGIVPMPLIPEIQAAIDKKVVAIGALEIEIAKEEKKKEELEKFKKLLYSSGPELEEIFAACLTKCGGTVTPARYSQEEFVLEHKGLLYLVECKGVGKSTALTHVRQLFDYMTKFEEDTKREGKGVLFVNAWKDLSLNDRGQSDTVIFPDNVITRGRALGIALVSSVDFFSSVLSFSGGRGNGRSNLG